MKQKKLNIVKSIITVLFIGVIAFIFVNGTPVKSQTDFKKLVIKMHSSDCSKDAERSQSSSNVGSLLTLNGKWGTDIKITEENDNYYFHTWTYFLAKFDPSTTLCYKCLQNFVDIFNGSQTNLRASLEKMENSNNTLLCIQAILYKNKDEYKRIGNFCTVVYDPLIKVLDAEFSTPYKDFYGNCCKSAPGVSSSQSQKMDFMKNDKEGLDAFYKVNSSKIKNLNPPAIDLNKK